ncbi:RHS domain-containing protein [Variovorax sp. WDL1]|uniref:RHS domain-containing protein n=1 Tax=Variovorax sp. WDL1 TaxID=207745 RepID=UPI003FCD3707
MHSDHLNTPRRLIDSQGQPVWQWSYSAFGDEKPTIAKCRSANLDITPNPDGRHLVLSRAQPVRQQLSEPLW